METNQREGEGIGGQTSHRDRKRPLSISSYSVCWLTEDGGLKMFGGRNFFNCVYYSYFFAVVIARYDTTKNRTDKFSFAVH